MRFELTRGNPNGLAVHRLNHSATTSADANVAKILILTVYFLLAVTDKLSECPEQALLWLRAFNVYIICNNDIH